MRAVLTIAGSDSIAGAGVQADLKTFAAFGVYGVSVLTAITSQNTSGVRQVLPLPASVIASQIDAIVDDVELAAVKTGMLATADNVKALLERLGDDIPNLVVDPVMAASYQIGVGTLLDAAGVSTLRTALLPRALVVTPNVAEAAVLSAVTVDSLETAREAARRISDLGPKAVVVKGGHLPDANATDVLYHDGKFTEFASARSRFTSVHGTGCTFASAIAAALARGDDIPGAVARAKHYITGAIEHSIEIGAGARVLNHFWELSL